MHMAMAAQVEEHSVSAHAWVAIYLARRIDEEVKATFATGEAISLLSLVKACREALRQTVNLASPSA